MTVAGNAVFLAAPFIDIRDDIRKVPTVEYRTLLMRLINDIEEAGYRVFSAHREGMWGDTEPSASEVINEDLEWLRHADVVVAIIEDPPSPGVQLELGMALALNKPIIQIRQKRKPLPYPNEGFNGSIRNTYTIEFDDVSDCTKQVTHKLMEILPVYPFQQHGRTD